MFIFEKQKNICTFVENNCNDAEKYFILFADFSHILC
jgi:hypothetical protein